MLEASWLLKHGKLLVYMSRAVQKGRSVQFSQNELQATTCFTGLIAHEVHLPKWIICPSVTIFSIVFDVVNMAFLKNAEAWKG